MGRALRAIKLKHMVVALIAVMTTIYVYCNTDAHSKVRSIFRKHMQAISPLELQKMAKDSQVIADKLQPETPGTPKEPEIIPEEEPVVEKLPSPEDSVIKGPEQILPAEIPHENIIENLSKEIAVMQIKEAMVLQPQAGFGSPQEEVDRLYDYMKQQIPCDDLHYIGTVDNKGKYEDGAYAGCLSPGFWPEKGEPCLGYSFGIDYEWKFDEGLEALGCQIHSFDPGMYDEPEHAKHSENILFHRWGIGEIDSDALYQRAMRDYAYRKKYGDAKLEELRKWKVRTLSSIIRELGHNGRIIDAVKIDIEGPRIGYEDKAIRNIIETGAYKCVRQLTLELHVFGPVKNGEYVRMQYSIMKALEDKGFKLFDVKESFGRDMEDIRQKITTEKTQLLWCLGWVNPNPEPCNF